MTRVKRQSQATGFSAGDLKEGFNQCDNEPETAENMAVLVVSGTCLPKGLTFGPTSGPEDFQELVFIVFSRRLYKEWFLFLDDLSVATGRPAPHPPGPSDAHDVVTAIIEQSEKMRAAKGAGPIASSDPSPYPHDGVPKCSVGIRRSRLGVSLFQCFDIVLIIVANLINPAYAASTLRSTFAEVSGANNTSLHMPIDT